MYNTDGSVLIIERPHPAGPNPNLATANGHTEIASLYSTTTNTFVPVHFPTLAFCSGTAFGPDGEAWVIGGAPIRTARQWCGDAVGATPGYIGNGFFDVRRVQGTNVATVANMPVARWYPTAITLADGRIFIAGGSHAEAGGYGAMEGDASLYEDSYQLLTPSTGSLSPPASLPVLTDTWPVNLYPAIFVLPITSSIAVFAGTRCSTQATIAPAHLSSDPSCCRRQTGTPTLLPLDPANSYAPEIVFFGGSSADMATATTPASSSSYRINMAATNPTYLEEEMPSGRLMGDAVLMPDGTVGIFNGAQTGIAGGIIGASAATNPTTVPVVYNPYAAVGSRYSEWADSKIPRLYHSVAFLLLDATVSASHSAMVKGSEMNEVMVMGSEVTEEYRVQVFTPPYLQTGASRPTITTAPAAVGYAKQFSVGYKGTTSIDRVVMIRQSAVTHSLHTDAREVVLVINSSTPSSVTCTSPPDPSIAVPGQHCCRATYVSILHIRPTSGSISCTSSVM
eukprot:jgi/Astpho2/3681/Aster-04872